MTLAEFIKHRGVNYELISKVSPSDKNLSRAEIVHIETELKYTGYLEREFKTAAKMKNFDGAKIPENFDYDSVVGLRAECLQKLKHFKPASLGQALRISGVTPADVQLISVIISRNERSKHDLN